MSKRIGIRGSGGGGGGGFSYGGTYANYSALPDPTLNPNKLFYVIASQGTYWLPGSLGGTFYSNGWYYSDGVSYTHQDTPFNASQPTVDAGTNNDQFVTPLTLTNAVHIKTGDIDPSVVNVGGITIGMNIDNLTLKQFAQRLCNPELFPALTNPSSAFTLTQEGLHEIGELIATLNFGATFSRGSISPAYGTSGFRSGLPNTYIYAGTGLSNFASTSLTDSKTVSSYSVISGAQSWTGRVAYDIGEQPKSSYGNNYSTPLAAGNTGIVTRSITGVYPIFATTSNITTLTKQALQTNGSVVDKDFVAESGSDKQMIEFPATWGAITVLEQYNTLSGTFDVISLATFTVTNVFQTVQGNSVAYKRYLHNGGTIGQRRLKWTV